MNLFQGLVTINRTIHSSFVRLLNNGGEPRKSIDVCYSWKESWHYEMFQMQLAAIDLCKSYCALEMRPCDINYSAKIGFEERRLQYFSWSSFVCSVSNVSHWPIFVIFTSWGKLAAARKTDEKMGVGRNVGMSSVCGGGSLSNMDDSCMHCASLIHSPSILYLISIIKGRWTLSQLWLVFLFLISKH